MSYFGATASFFLMLTFSSILILIFSILHFIRREGLLKFMPPGLQKLFTEVSFFEILVEVLIYRRISKMLIAILTPFIKANTPEEAKEMLKRNGQISENVYKGIFKKVS